MPPGISAAVCVCGRGQIPLCGNSASPTAPPLLPSPFPSLCVELSILGWFMGQNSFLLFRVRWLFGHNYSRPNRKEGKKKRERTEEKTEMGSNFLLSSSLTPPNGGPGRLVLAGQSTAGTPLLPCLSLTLPSVTLSRSCSPYRQRQQWLGGGLADLFISNFDV